MHSWIILWTGGRCLLQFSPLTIFWNFQKLWYWNLPILQPKFWWFFCPEKQSVGWRKQNIFQTTALLTLYLKQHHHIYILPPWWILWGAFLVVEDRRTKSIKTLKTFVNNDDLGVMFGNFLFFWWFRTVSTNSILIHKIWVKQIFRNCIIFRENCLEVFWKALHPMCSEK